MGMVLQSLNSTVADSQDDVVLASEDEALVVNYGLQNLGFSSESVDWMLQAKLQNTIRPEHWHKGVPCLT